MQLEYPGGEYDPTTAPGGDWSPDSAYYGTASAQQDPMAIGALVTGVIGLLMSCCCWPLGLLLAFVAIGLGVFSVFRINADPDRYTGKGLAFGGIGAGAAAILLGVLMLALGVMGQLLQYASM